MRVPVSNYTFSSQYSHIYVIFAAMSAESSNAPYLHIGQTDFYIHRPVHPPYSSVFVTEFNPEYGITDLLIWLRKRSSPKYGNAPHLNIFLR